MATVAESKCIEGTEHKHSRRALEESASEQLNTPVIVPPAGSSAPNKSPQSPRSNAVSVWLGFTQRANRQVPNESLAFFRITFGLLIFASSLRFIHKGWVDSLYVNPQHHLHYNGFGWVEPLSSFWMHALMYSLAVCGLAIAAGYKYRWFCAVFMIGFSYTELIEASLYLNHYWFMNLVALLILFLPMDRRWSLDVALANKPKTQTTAVAAVWVLRFQIGVVYTFAGLAKLNPDWLFHAQPMKMWLAARTDFPVIGYLFNFESTAYLFSWAGAAFDLSIFALLLNRRTRKYAYVGLVGFHTMTGLLFKIGVFPWVMSISALIFFDYDWPKTLLKQLRQLVKRPVKQSETPNSEVSRMCFIGGSEGSYLSKSALFAVGVFALIQVLLPIRHYGYSSNVRWSEEGYYLAWRVMLTQKHGTVTYLVTDPKTGASWEASPGLILGDRQERFAAVRPDLIHETALMLERYYQKNEGFGDLEVRAQTHVSFNGRKAVAMIDPTVDLTGQKRSLAPKEWILAAPGSN